jgi:hypothetical protein
MTITLTIFSWNFDILSNNECCRPAGLATCCTLVSCSADFQSWRWIVCQALFIYIYIPSNSSNFFRLNLFKSNATYCQSLLNFCIHLIENCITGCSPERSDIRICIRNYSRIYSMVSFIHWIKHTWIPSVCQNVLHTMVCHPRIYYSLLSPLWVSQIQQLRFFSWYLRLGARGNAVGWGTLLEAGKSRVRFPMRSLNFFNLRNPSNCTMALGFIQPLTEWVPGIALGGGGQ